MAASDRRGVSGEVEICSKSVTVEQKRIFFNLKQNSRGRFLKVRPWAGVGCRKHVARGALAAGSPGDREGAVMGAAGGLGAIEWRAC